MASPSTPVLFAPIWGLVTRVGTGAPQPEIQLLNPVPEYGGQAVFRRFDPLSAAVQAVRLPPGAHVEVALVAARDGSVVRVEAGPAGQDRMDLSWPLRQRGRRLPVGRSRLESRVVTAKPPATRPAGAEVPNIGATTQVLTGDAEYTWDLGTYTQQVLNLALSSVDGQTNALGAATRLRDVANKQVVGYWPGLTDSTGRRPPGAPAADARWDNPWGVSVPANLSGSDRRGQCFDYATLFAGLARSIGIPATVVTGVDLAPMPYPYQTEWDITWEYHVWNEFRANGIWWATDATYPVNATYAEPYRAGPSPQPRPSGWFAAVADRPETRISAEVAGVRQDLTAAYVLGLVPTSGRPAPHLRPPGPAKDSTDHGHTWVRVSPSPSGPGWWRWPWRHQRRQG